MSEMASDTSLSSSADTPRRRSTFYVSLVPSETPPVTTTSSGLGSNDQKQRSVEQIYNPDLSAFSFDWSLNDSLNSSEVQTTSSNERENKLKRYGVVLNASVNIDDDETTCHQQQQQQQKQSNTSTPIRLVKSRSRGNILSNFPKALPSATSSNLTALSPVKEKSKTLPQNVSLANTFPPKSSFLLKSTPRISLNYSSDAATCVSMTGLSSQTASASPNKKSLNFIRRAHSTKLSRSNSLLKSLTSRCVDHSSDNSNLLHVPVKKLDNELLYRCLENPAKTDDMLKDLFIWCKYEKEDETAVHSDTSYEKACRRGSAPSTPVLGQKTESTSRFTNFFSKRSFRSNPLKRTKSVTKLERSKRGQGGLRGSRSHESLLSNHAVMSTIDLSCVGAIGVVPVHASVLGRRHCFQIRGGPRGERYYSCGSRQERDLWIYSLRRSIAPNSEHIRRVDNSLKMWIYEAKSLPPKKRYFCEINLDKTLYGRTSVKLRTDLLFWGEYFDFPDVPELNVITVNVFREADKKKKRDKHVLVGTVKIPIQEVTSRTFAEDWYQIIPEKPDSIIKSSSKEPISTLRIKCRFQSIDILPLAVYQEFLDYLKGNYKKVCEMLEPIIGVKAKEDIGQALVLLMHAQGIAAAFLTDVVALDLLRVDDQRLTFRGNSLATKSMEAFLKLTGEQYLQDTLSAPIAEIIASDRDCEVDPLKANGSLSRQQQALRNAVKTVWVAISESSKIFPAQLRDCFSTFRERLQDLDRDDMADNLISASIFLRFLCPAILSPSLFNITNELPSARATRNLTLVAKTLQTLANFTRFQGKENFMEFLNDFLEQEAPRMKQFLYDISSTEHPVQESILDWSGYIDQGKQLSILHSLLSETILKMSPEKQDEIHPLPTILESITHAKETNNLGQSQQNVPMQPLQQQQENLPPILGKLSLQGAAAIPSPSERGVIRGVLTPGSLEKNIFRYNDPTVRGLLAQPLQQQQHYTSSNGSLNSQSTSSVSLSSNSIQHNSVSSTNGTSGGGCGPVAASTKPVGRSGYYHSNQQQSVPGSSSSGKPSGGSTVSVTTNSLRTEKEKSPTLSNSGIRASTLPRNNSHPTTSALTGNSESGPFTGVEREMGGNNVGVANNLIQIGFDPSNPFNRKSPTPLLKSNMSSYSYHSGTRNRNQNGSQLSLLTNSELGKNALSLGIPHSDMLVDSFTMGPSVTSGAGILSTTGTSSNDPSNMPMSLEDLEDLLNYADEQKKLSGENVSCRGISSSSSGGSGSAAPIGIGNGSNVSIGQISNICSSGYQSISTQSRSSSPVDLGGQRQIEYVTNKVPPPRKLSTTFVGGGVGSGVAKYGFGGQKFSTSPSIIPGTFDALHPQHTATIGAKTNSASHNNNNSESMYQKSNLSKYANNNNVDCDGGSYSIVPSYLGTPSAFSKPDQTQAVVHSALNGNTRNVGGTSMTMIGGLYGNESGELYQGSHQRKHHVLPKHHHTGGAAGMRGSGESLHSESSSDEQFSSNAAENYRELDSLTTASNNRVASAATIGGGLYGRRTGSSRMPRTNPMIQYKRDDASETHNFPLGGSNSSNSIFVNGHYRDHSFNNQRLQRRLSVESGRTLSDSSTDDTESGPTKPIGPHHHQIHHHTSAGGGAPSQQHHINVSREYESKRRRNVNKSVEQCEREIQRLQASLDSMRQKLEMSEPKEGVKDDLEDISHHSDSKIRSIIGRLLTMEEELRQEQYKMSLALSHKQRVIEAQGQQIAALDAANNRLLSALSSLQNRYENQSNQSDDTTTSSSHPNAGASSC
ncbi:ras GTPase-activating protein raskol [Anopheles ziemanni]|uniref:ras GTPase-activating protein raskol n=1 Tax=Anopheles ziemanni TaxID=345580 RepID=UPI00265FCB0B|nr:ras GTPase-activating protein raskol [Anopheles ziemanni]